MIFIVIEFLLWAKRILPLHTITTHTFQYIPVPGFIYWNEAGNVVEEKGANTHIRRNLISTFCGYIAALFLYHPRR